MHCHLCPEVCAVEDIVDHMRVMHPDVEVGPVQIEVAPPWACKTCGSARWVAASVTGPVEYGGRAIRQCVPCGRYGADPVESTDA